MSQPNNDIVIQPEQVIELIESKIDLAELKYKIFVELNEDPLSSASIQEQGKIRL
ncbi:MAG: hypothetical protein WC510_02095 [Candidatus Omnitrophota bacterium]